MGGGPHSGGDPLEAEPFTSAWKARPVRGCFGLMLSGSGQYRNGLLVNAVAGWRTIGRGWSSSIWSSANCLDTNSEAALTSPRHARRTSSTLLGCKKGHSVWRAATVAGLTCDAAVCMHGSLSSLLMTRALRVAHLAMSTCCSSSWSPREPPVPIGRGSGAEITAVNTDSPEPSCPSWTLLDCAVCMHGSL